MSGMKKPSTTSLAVSLIIMAAGIAALGLGGRLFLSGAALADQTGNSGQMSGGVALSLFGLFMLFAPASLWLARTWQADHARYQAWKKTLTPNERLAVNTAETAALAAAAVAGWEATRAGSRRIGERYQASAEVSKLSDAAFMEQIQAGTPAGLAAPYAGQPEPGQYQPNASS
jgi:hypothetical protein